MKVLRFLKCKRKRILYFLVGMFFSFFTIMNNFIIVKAADAVNSEMFFGNYEIQCYMSDEGVNSKTVLPNHDGVIFDSDRGGAYQFINQHLTGLSNIFNSDYKCVIIGFGDNANQYQLLYIYGDDLNISDLFITYGRTGAFEIVSKKNFSTVIGGNSLSTSTPATAVDGGYYQTYYGWSGYRGFIPNFGILRSTTLSNSEIRSNYLAGNMTDISIYNQDMYNYLVNNMSSFYQNSPYYNGYLKNFSVDWVPVIPESNSISEVNEILFEGNNIRLTYDPNQTQINNIEKYLINAKYTYGLQLKFYGYNMESVTAYCNSAQSVVTEIWPSYSIKYARIYQNALDNYIHTLTNAGFIVIESNKTWQYIEYTARLNFSVLRSYKVSQTGVNNISSFSVFDSYYNNVLNAVSNNLLGMTVPYNVINEEDNYNRLYSGYECAELIWNSPYLKDHSYTITVPLKITDMEIENVDLNGFGVATDLIGNITVMYDTLQCEYVMNTNKSSKYTCKFDFVNGTKEIIDNTIGTKPVNDPNINDKNEVINTGDSFNNNVVNGTGGGSGGSGGVGGSSSSSSNSSGGNATATSNSGGNTQNVTVQNGLNWADKPFNGQNITVGSSINTGLNTITSMMSTNGFVPIISTWFSFIPQPFWNLITTVFTICILLLVFKFFLWII